MDICVWDIIEDVKSPGGLAEAQLGSPRVAGWNGVQRAGWLARNQLEVE